jgi:hypothetical protein
MTLISNAPILQFGVGRKQGNRTGDDSETIENPASNFRRLNGRDDFHTAATARALQHEKWAK